MKSCSKGSIIALILITVSVAPYIAAQGVSRDSSNPALNTIYGELSGIAIFGAISANYERMLFSSLSVRGGVGAGYSLASYNREENAGVLGMLLYHTSASDHKFEAGIGICWMSITPQAASPTVLAITAGYRYQPHAGGIFFRAGASYSYTYGFPFQISVGQTF